MAYMDTKSNNKIKLTINGIEIPLLSGYSYYDVKSFFKEPERSTKGIINNLNSYPTFLTPRLRFSFNAMPIGAYRIIMRLIKEFSEFIVTAYDIVEDEYVTHKMYFHPKEFPNIYQKSFEVLRILNESFEMVGTNASLDEYSLVYNDNTEIENTTGYTFYYGNEVIIGSFDEGFTDPTTFTNGTNILVGWNTKSDYTGDEYFTNETVMLTSSKVLYAHWKATTEFVLSFDYQGATGNNTIINKDVIQNNAIGTLPIPVKNGYIFSGWFTQLYGNGTEVTLNTVYTYSNNITIYAHWIGANNNLIFNSGDGTGTMENEIVKSGESFTLPKCSFIKNGYSFIGWTNDSEGVAVIYQDEATITIPNTDLTLYALYKQSFYLTYKTNDGSNNDYSEFGSTFKNPIYTEKYGYNFIGWYSDIELLTGVTFPLSIEENTTIYAKWEAIE